MNITQLFFTVNTITSLSNITSTSFHLRGSIKDISQIDLHQNIYETSNPIKAYYCGDIINLLCFERQKSEFNQHKDLIYQLCSLDYNFEDDSTYSIKHAPDMINQLCNESEARMNIKEKNVLNKLCECREFQENRYKRTPNQS